MTTTTAEDETPNESIEDAGARIMADADWLKCEWCGREFNALRDVRFRWQGEMRAVRTCWGCECTPFGFPGIANDFEIKGATVMLRVFASARRAKGDRLDDRDHYAIVSIGGREFMAIAMASFRVRVRFGVEFKESAEFANAFEAWGYLAAQVGKAEPEGDRLKRAVSRGGKDAASGEQLSWGVV